MIEGIGTVTNTNQAHSQAVHSQTEGIREIGQEVAEGKVNSTEKFENLSEESTPDNGNNTDKPYHPDNQEGNIINLLG